MNDSISLLPFVILKDFIKPSSPCKSNTYKRNFKNFDSNKLKEGFCEIDWDKVLRENDNNINDAINGFYKTLTEILDHHAPLIKITKKGTNLTPETLNKQRNPIFHVEKR